MKTGIFFTARLGSSRLKQKHLLQVAGQPIFSYLIKRVRDAFQKEIVAGKIMLVIVTSDEAENRRFEQFEVFGVKVFYGSLSNIPLRHLQAANTYGVDNIIAIDGDDILCSVTGLRRIYEELQSGGTYVKTAGLPFGMNGMGYATKFLQASLTKGGKSQTILETGWGRIFDETGMRVVEFKLNNCHTLMRFTLDYPEDFTFFEEVLAKLPVGLEKATDQEIVDCVEAEQLYEITRSIAAEYWNNFDKGVKKESI